MGRLAPFFVRFCKCPHCRIFSNSISHKPKLRIGKERKAKRKGQPFSLAVLQIIFAFKPADDIKPTGKLNVKQGDNKLQPSIKGLNFWVNQIMNQIAHGKHRVDQHDYGKNNGSKRRKSPQRPLI